VNRPASSLISRFRFSFSLSGDIKGHALHHGNWPPIGTAGHPAGTVLLVPIFFFRPMTFPIKTLLSPAALATACCLPVVHRLVENGLTEPIGLLSDCALAVFCLLSGPRQSPLAAVAVDPDLGPVPGGCY
jgi:hypothetical protein